MNQKDLTKLFMMLSNRNKPFDLQCFYKKNQCFKGQANDAFTVDNHRRRWPNIKSTVAVDAH